MSFDDFVLHTYSAVYHSNNIEYISILYGQHEYRRYGEWSNGSCSWCCEDVQNESLSSQQSPSNFIGNNKAWWLWDKTIEQFVYQACWKREQSDEHIKCKVTCSLFSSTEQSQSQYANIDVLVREMNSKIEPNRLIVDFYSIESSRWEIDEVIRKKQ